MIRLKEAWLLGFFLIIPALVFFYWLCDAVRKKALSKFAEERFFKSLTRNFSKDRRNVKRALIAAALFFLILAMARPQFGTKFETVYGRGVNIVIALDTSKSMLAEDFKPNRLKKAQHQIDSFINRLSGDRVGLVFFAGDAFTYCPLTMDYGTARLFLSDVEPGIIETPGTNLSRALQVAMKAFPEKQIQGQSNVIVLLTDGEDHSGQAVEAAKEAAKRGIKIYTIGIGSLEGALIPVTDNQGRREYKKNRSGEFVQTKLDVETLQKIALEGDGQFYHSTPGEMELEQILEEISGLEKSSISNRRYRVYEDRFQIPLFIVLFLLVVEMLISERKSRDYIVLSPLEGGLYSSTSKNLITILALMGFVFSFLFSGTPAYASSEEISNLIKQGNKHLAENRTEEALECFNQAQTLDPMDKRIFYNLGRAYYMQKEYEQADKQFSEAATSRDKSIRSKAWYNMGNSLFQQKKMGESIQAYTEALKENPDDMDAKYNIELVRRIIKENAKNQQQNQQQQQQNKEKQEKQNQDQQQGGQQQKQDSSKDEQDKKGDQKKQQAKMGDKDQDKKDQDKKDQQDKDEKGEDKQQAQMNEKEKKEKEDQEKKKQAAKEQEKAEKEKHEKQQEEQKKKEMSKEEAERMLDSLQDEEKQMRQEQIKRLGNPSRNIEKDW